MLMKGVRNCGVFLEFLKHESFGLSVAIREMTGGICTIENVVSLGAGLRGGIICNTCEYLLPTTATRKAKTRKG